MTDQKIDDEGQTSCGCGCGPKMDACTSSCGVKLAVILAFVLLVIGVASYYVSQSISNDVAQVEVMPMATKTVTLERSDLKKISVKVEVAKSMAQQKIGLMNRTSLAQNTGMIFTYDTPQKVRFWMKDTLLPLDMLFVLPDGTIYKIVSGAKPNDETPIPSEVAVMAVLELAAGEVKRMGIKVGDTLNF